MDKPLSETHPSLVGATWRIDMSKMRGSTGHVLAQMEMLSIEDVQLHTRDVQKIKEATLNLKRKFCRHIWHKRINALKVTPPFQCPTMIEMWPQFENKDCTKKQCSNCEFIEEELNL